MNFAILTHFLLAETDSHLQNGVDMFDTERERAKWISLSQLAKDLRFIALSNSLKSNEIDLWRYANTRNTLNKTLSLRNYRLKYSIASMINIYLNFRENFNSHNYHYTKYIRKWWLLESPMKMNVFLLLSSWIRWTRAAFISSDPYKK